MKTRLESPIEEAFHAALLRVASDWCWATTFARYEGDLQLARGGDAPNPLIYIWPADEGGEHFEGPDIEVQGRGKGSLFIYPQCRVGPYRADFLLVYWGFLGMVQLVVECDGHDFHERTKEQAARDRRRDREIQANAGLPVLRFTGSEIHRDAERCAREALALLEDRLAREMDRVLFLAKQMKKSEDGGDGE